MNEVQDHPSIIEMKCVYESIDKLYIVMTACSGGELFERIQADDGFSEKKASKVFANMLSALFYIHSKGIVHCDLKPENFIFKNKVSKSRDYDNCEIKLIDFGMAKVVRWRKYYNRMNGTPYYIAPEVLDGKYNQSCDMWSMGVILFILVFGFPPFFDASGSSDKTATYKIIYKKIKMGFNPTVKPGYGAWFPSDIDVSNEYKDLVSRLLRTDIASRLSAEEALAHPWITKTTSLKTEALPAIRSLRKFRRTCALKNDILQVLLECKFLNRDQEAAVKKTFEVIDKDGDGIITLEELYEVMKQVDPDITRGEVKEVLIAVDVNGDDVLTLDEFLSARINRKVMQKEERLRKLFKCLDVDDSGCLSVGEICAALESARGKKVMKMEVEKLVEEVDVDHDGVIDYEEFLAMFKKSEVLSECME